MSRGGDFALLARLSQCLPAAPGLDFRAQGIAAKRNADGDGLLHLARVILRDRDGFLGGVHGCLGARELEVTLRSGEHRVLSLRLEAGLGRVHELARREILVDGGAEIDLCGERRAVLPRILVHVDDVARDVLREMIVPAIHDARRDPREKIPAGRHLRGLRLGELFTRDFDLEVPRACEPQRRRQIDRVAQRRRRLGCEGDAHDAKNKKRKAPHGLHGALTAFTGWLGLSASLPTSTTDSSASTPFTTSTCCPS